MMTLNAEAIATRNASGGFFLCHSVVYGQAIPSVIGQKSVALTLDSIELYKHQHI